jgi:hypothetical protein
MQGLLFVFLLLILPALGRITVFVRAVSEGIHMGSGFDGNRQGLELKCDILSTLSCFKGAFDVYKRISLSRLELDSIFYYDGGLFGAGVMLSRSGYPDYWQDLLSG